MSKINAIIKDGKVYEVVPNPANDCSKCGLKKECDQISTDYCLVDRVFGCKEIRIFRYSQSLTDKLNKK